MAIIEPTGGGTLVAVKVVPAASRDAIAGRLGARLKVTVRKPPERGAANKAACRLVAKALGLRAADVTLVSGPARPEKVLRVEGMEAAEVARRLGIRGAQK